MAGPLSTYSTQSHVEKVLYLFIAIFKQPNIYYKIQKWLFHTSSAIVIITIQELFLITVVFWIFSICLVALVHRY